MIPTIPEAKDTKGCRLGWDKSWMGQAADSILQICQQTWESTVKNGQQAKQRRDQASHSVLGGRAGSLFRVFVVSDFGSAIALSLFDFFLSAESSNVSNGVSAKCGYFLQLWNCKTRIWRKLYRHWRNSRLQLVQVQPAVWWLFVR